MTAKGSNTMVDAVTTNTAELDASVTKAVTMCQDEHAGFLIFSLAKRADLCGKNACGAEVSLLKNKSQSSSQVHSCFPINSC